MVYISNSAESGLKCVKWMLLIINVMFMITAILLILVGTTISSIFTDFDSLIDDHFFSVSSLLVAVGILMLAVSVFGCFGAIKKSTMLVNIYGCLLVLILILEISAAIAAFCLQGEIKGMLQRNMKSSIEQYNTSIAVTTYQIDSMQSNLQCCGIENPEDWEKFNPEIQIPDSCKSSSQDIYPEGCLQTMLYIVAESATLIATGALTVAFVQFLGVLCAFMLAKTIRRNKTMRDARRWQLQQNLGITLPGKFSPPSQEGYMQMENNGFAIKKTDPVTYTANSPSVN